jgi:hypothetical protein
MTPEIFKMTKIRVTPRELRRLADALEKEWKEIKIGDDLPTRRIYGVGCEVVFVVDQGRMQDEERIIQRGVR